MHLLAYILQAGVTHQRAREQPSFTQYLKAVADPDDQPALGGKFLYRFHCRSKRCNSAGAQVITVGEATGNDDRIRPLQIFRLVPDHAARLLGDLRYHVVCVVVAVRTGKNDHAKFHSEIAPDSSLTSKIKGLYFVLHTIVLLT